MIDDDDDATHPELTDHRPLALLLAVVAMLCLGYSQASERWLLSPGGGTGFGLRADHKCDYNDVCSTSSNLDFVDGFDRLDANGHPEHASTVFPFLGWATSGLIAVGWLGLLATLIVALLHRRPQWTISPTTIALFPLMLAMITGCLFCATKPGEASFVGVAIGFWVFGAGEICAIIASLLLSRVIRPHDLDLTAGAMNPDEF